MPNEISAWDRLSIQSAQLLVCDLQPEIVPHSKTVDKKTIGRSAGVLLELAELFALPTTFSVVLQSDDPPELISELRDRHFARIRPRASSNPFLDNATVETLSHSGRDVLILAGVASEIVVLHAALSARAHGYQVLIPVDVSGSLSERTEQAAFRMMEAAGCVTTSIYSIATKLAPDFTADLGQRMFAIVQKLLG